MKIGGLDIGTTGCKLTVFDEKGNYLDKAYRTYPVSRGTSEHELDAMSIMDGVKGVMKEIGEKYPDIAGIGVTSFGEAFAMTDEDGRPLHRTMLYTDQRGSDESRELGEKLGGEDAYAAITGVRPHSMYSMGKMLWIRRNWPEVYAAAKHVFLMEDFVVWHLTGKAQIDYSLAARTMAFDIRNLCWSQEIFDAAGIDVSLMSEPVPSGTPAGTIRPEVAAETGMNPETKIVSIGHDQVACCVGAGAFDPTVAADGAGTVESMDVLYDHIPEGTGMYDGSFAVVPYILPGMYITYAFSYTGGALIQWCVETLAKKESEEAAAAGASVNAMLEGDYQEPTGLLVLPHFAGAATPYMDNDSKGAIVGMNMATTVSDIYRACMEGVVYEMMINVEALKKAGISFDSMQATGGGARSKVWMQMKADVLNLPMTALKTADAGTVGSAMLTGIATGIFRDLEDAADHMVQKTETYVPRPEMHEKYMKIYEKYRRLYDAVRPLV